MPNQKQNNVPDFLQIFADSVKNTFLQILDNDICKNIQYTIKDIVSISNIDNLENGNVICKADYATGSRNGTMIFLIPEEMVASLADITIGGDGKGVYNGSLSELEINSMKKILSTVFTNIEKDFKEDYTYNLAFSPNFKIIVKGMPEFNLASNLFFDLLVVGNLSLNEDQNYEIKLLTSTSIVESLADDLGSKRKIKPPKSGNSSLSNLELISDVKINITAELGRTRVPIKYALELVRGSLIELDTLNNEDIKVFANGVEFAKAQVVAVEDSFGLRITKIKSKEGDVPNTGLTTMAIQNAVGPKTAAAAQGKKEEAKKAPKKIITTFPPNKGEWLEKINSKVHEIIAEYSEDAAKLKFDVERAKRIADYAFKMGVYSGYSEKMLDEVQQAAYMHNIGIVTLEKSDLEDIKAFPKKQAKASYDLLLENGFSQAIADTAKFCINSYKSHAFDLTKPIPYHHIVAIASSYESLIDQGLSKQKALDSMLQSGGNRFNIFVLHKFIRLMRESG